MRVLSASLATLVAAGPCLAAFAPAQAEPAAALRVLEDGALPMPALALRIERWIASVEARSAR